MHHSFVQQNNVNVAGNNSGEIKQSHHQLGATPTSLAPLRQHLLSPQHQQAQQTSSVKTKNYKKTAF